MNNKWQKKMSCDNFRKFHRNNPRVFHLVLKYAYMHKDRGHYSLQYRDNNQRDSTSR